MSAGPDVRMLGPVALKEQHELVPFTRWNISTGCEHCLEQYNSALKNNTIILIHIGKYTEGTQDI